MSTDSTPPPLPNVLVILASYQGSSFIVEQIASLHSQIGVNITLAISDDGSSDDTLECARNFCESNSIPLISFLNSSPSGSACIIF